MRFQFHLGPLIIQKFSNYIIHHHLMRKVVPFQTPTVSWLLASKFLELSKVIRLWHYQNISIFLLINVVPISVRFILNAVHSAALSPILPWKTPVVTCVLIVNHLLIALILVQNSYLGSMILSLPTIQHGYALLLNGYHLILLQISQKLGVIFILFPCCFHFHHILIWDWTSLWLHFIHSIGVMLSVLE